MIHRAFPKKYLPGSAFRFPYGPPKNSDADASESFHNLRGNLPRPEKVSPGHFFSPAEPGSAFRFPYGPPKNSDAIASEFFGDPYGNRTHVTAVKGRCLNRLTNGPGSGNLVRTDDKPGMNRVLYQLSYTAKSIVSSTAMNSFVIIQDKPPFVKRKMKYFSPFWHRQSRSEPLLPKIPVIARHGGHCPPRNDMGVR